MMKVELMKKVNIKTILILIISIFAVLNLSWFLVTTFKYDGFVEPIPKNKWGLHFIKKDNYVYSVKKPDYLYYTGNLAVDNTEKQTSLLIWPLISGGYKYGFRLQEEGEAYEIYVDKNMEPTNKDKGDPDAVQKVEEHKAELEELFSKANEMWQFE
ncbi:hypothetical protein SC499_24720 [Peribacillus simplex]|uniref:hypothetical protein n=1 Tax=Peribacillus simplex TaxID=1478 RepID=UPI00298E3456|nr:hypothetical protein [Peribacillus simplex]MDW7617788.1 hypothetical protein [Peribacillus simplex]